MTDRDQLIFFNNRIKAIWVEIDAYLGAPVGPPPVKDPVDPLPPPPVFVGPISTRPFPPYGGTAANLFEFQLGVVYAFPIPIDTAGNIAFAGEGIYPEGMDAECCVSKNPGDFSWAKTKQVATAGGGFNSMVSYPYYNKVSNGSGIAWRGLPAGEQWWVSFRSNNKTGQCVLQSSKQS